MCVFMCVGIVWVPLPCIEVRGQPGVSVFAYQLVGGKISCLLHSLG